MSEPRPIRIVIAGTGLAGAMSAAALSRALPKQLYEVVLVDVEGADDSVGAFGAVEATLPTVRPYFAGQGIDETALLEAAAGCFTLGVAFAGWSGRDRAYFAPYGDIGAALGGVAFHQLVSRLRAGGSPIRPTDYAMATLLAQAGRFAHPSNDSRSPLSSFTYGLHLDRDAAASAFSAMAAQQGAIFAAAPLERVGLDADGGIGGIVLGNGDRVEADLYVDTTGPRRLLIGAMPESLFQSWGEWLPCDRTAELICSAEAAPSPYSLNSAHSCGWQRTVPGRGVVGEAMVYSSALLDDEGARALLLENAHGKAAAEVRFSQYRPGRLERPWLRNCVAIGAAAAELEPLQSTSVHLVHSAVERLLKLIPVALPAKVEAREYNRLTADELDRTRDFTILRYKINRRAGDPFWDAARAMEVPDALAYKIDQYSGRGRVPLLDGDLFEPPEWSVVFDEHGVRPEQHDMLAAALPADQLSAQVARMRQIMIAAASSVPRHGDYLAQLLRKAAA